MARTKSHVQKLYNCSPQTLNIQVRKPGSDFYRGEQQIKLGPGKTVDLPKDHLIQEQILNLQSKRMLKVLFDSEKVEDSKAMQD